MLNDLSDLFPEVYKQPSGNVTHEIHKLTTKELDAAREIEKVSEIMSEELLFTPVFEGSTTSVVEAAMVPKFSIPPQS